jgi:hypothetical protein
VRAAKRAAGVEARQEREDRAAAARRSGACMGAAAAQSWAGRRRRAGAGCHVMLASHQLAMCGGWTTHLARMNIIL